MKKHMKKLIAMISAIAIVLTGMVIPKETVSAAFDAPYPAFIYKESPGDAVVVYSAEDEIVARQLGMYYIWGNNPKLLEAQALHQEAWALSDLETALYEDYMDALALAGPSPVLEDFADIFDSEAFNTAVSEYPQEPSLSNFSDLIEDGSGIVLKTAEEQFQEEYEAWVSGYPDSADYIIEGSGTELYELALLEWELEFAFEKAAYLEAASLTHAKAAEVNSAFDLLRETEYLGSGVKEDIPDFTPTINVRPAVITEIDKTIIERKGSEEVLVSQSLLDGTKAAPINVINSIQGYRCQEIFDAKAKESEPGTKVVRTYSFHAEGSTDQKPIYHTEDKVVISMTIPTAVREEGATYSFVCVSENGESFVFADEDGNPNTITITTDRFYAYALCVTPAANN